MLRKPLLSFQPTHIARLCWINRSTKSVPKETQGAKNESRFSDCTGGLQWSEITIPRNALRHAGYGDHAKRRNEYQTEFFIHVYDLPKLGAPDWQKLPPASLMKITIHAHRAVISVGARSC